MSSRDICEESDRNDNNSRENVQTEIEINAFYRVTMKNSSGWTDANRDAMVSATGEV